MYFPDLLEEYEELLKQMKLNGETSGAMYNEIKQSIEWMRTGYDPAEFRAMVRVDAYLVDPFYLKDYLSYVEDNELMVPEFLQNIKKKVVSDFCLDDNSTSTDEIINTILSNMGFDDELMDENRTLINNAFKGLTDNEKAAFLAIRVEKKPYSKVAEMLGVKKGSIQTYISRAEKKIKVNIS